MTRVIFACVHSAGRSQMAAALFNARVRAGVAEAVAAGTRPAARVHPEVVAVMKEIGLDLAAARPRLLDDALAAGASLLVTMGCGEACPFVPGLEVVDWALPDPKGQSIERVREIREEIGRRVAELIRQRGWSLPPPDGRG